MGKVTDITSYIPFGKDQAISRRNLCYITGLSDREVRQLISKARTTVVILNMQDSGGYFRPTEEDRYLVYEWLKQEKSRAKIINRSILAAEIECGARIDEG